MLKKQMSKVYKGEDWRHQAKLISFWDFYTCKPRISGNRTLCGTLKSKKFHRQTSASFLLFCPLIPWIQGIPYIMWFCKFTEWSTNLQDQVSNLMWKFCCGFSDISPHFSTLTIFNNNYESIYMWFYKFLDFVNSRNPLYYVIPQIRGIIY